MTELEVYKEIVESSFHLQLNMNDAFHWATADAEDLHGYDVERIVPICMKYGTSPTLLAYAAISRGYDSDHKKLLTNEYWAAKEELQLLANRGKILWEQWYDRKDKEIERSLFNGQEIVWESTPERIWKLRARLCKDKSPYVVKIARLPEGVWAIGGSTADTQERLLRKYNAKHNIPIKRCEFPSGDMTKRCVRCGLIAKYPGGGGRTGKDLDCIWPRVGLPKDGE